METALTLSMILNIMLFLILSTSVRYNNDIHNYMLKQRDMIEELFKLIKENNELRRQTKETRTS